MVGKGRAVGIDALDELVLNKLRKVRLLILDVDGVMTDGGIIIDDAGIESKQFDVKDGHGLKMLMRVDIAVVLLTGRKSRVVDHRAADLGIAEVHQGILNKVDAFWKILAGRKIAAEETAYLGDDVVDVPLLKRVGFSAAVADAVEEVHQVVDYVTRSRGGRGAVRELCELILKAQDRWKEVATRYEFS